jgi:hypothetical protein
VDGREGGREGERALLGIFHNGGVWGVARARTPHHNTHGTVGVIDSKISSESQRGVY